ncbi:alpha/beta-hydrolase [Gonapodya prolifera JEL478]|uniref:Alpha/beta-hydrolase n=1 Tax=Gonapodya prolifera (strain JEL478) TaxID=1344416 RepID=A0A139B0S5_GONPJ|nr:alpha/beta-hydrolase [Gonapodya prolifera JEL478]|eukprot:KXS22579.1 alpha/beta-hydrolase [Gonapodya prolifera JEL478]
MGAVISYYKFHLGRWLMFAFAQLFPRAAARRVVELFQRTYRIPPPKIERLCESSARVRNFLLAPLSRAFDTPCTNFQIPPWIKGYEFEPQNVGTPKGTVVFVHGFSGRATQFHAFLQPLAQRGYRVIALDMPGCGGSPGESANLVVFANALEAFVRANDINPSCVIAHSMGASSTLLFASYCQHSPYLDRLSSLVAISPPESLLNVLYGFGDIVGVGGSRAISVDFTTSSLLDKLSTRILLVHDSKDKEVPVSASRAIAASAQNVVDQEHSRDETANSSWQPRQLKFRYVETEGLGHKRILVDANIVEMVLDFVDETRDQ